MIVLVKGDAVGMMCNQRAEVVYATNERIIVVLCSNDAPKVIKKKDIIGLELSEQLTIKFEVHGWETTQSGGCSPFPQS